MLLDRSVFRSEYLKILDPVDVKDNRYADRDGEFWVKHLICHKVNPGTIVEIGVRSGYSGWAMKMAAPDAQYIGYDSYDPSYADQERVGRFQSWAKQILNMGGCSLIQIDTQKDGFIPLSADLYHVDGDHSYEGARRDIESCLKAGNSDAVVVVHDFYSEPVCKAVLETASSLKTSITDIAGSPQGDVLMFKGSVPEWSLSMGT